MILNESSINAEIINGYSQGLTISEVLRVSLNSSSKPIVVINEQTSLLESILIDIITNIKESIISTDTFNSKWTTAYTIDETSTVSDITRILFKNVCNESVTVQSSVLVSFIKSIIEQLTLLDTSQSKSIVYNTLLDSIHIVDGFISVSPILIQELLYSLVSLSQVVSANNTINESQTIAETINPILKLSFLINETSDIVDDTIPIANLKDLIKENMIFLPNINLGENTYSGWVMNTEIFAVTEYTDFNFNSLTKYLGRYFGCNSTGLYEFTGVKDDQNFIQVRIQTPAYDLNTSNIKMVPSLYFGIGQDNTIIVKASVDRNNTAYYRLPLASRELRTQQIKLGKGLVGKYWQLELIAENVTEFKLDSFEWFPIIFGRKL